MAAMVLVLVVALRWDKLSQLLCDLAMHGPSLSLVVQWQEWLVAAVPAV